MYFQNSFGFPNYFWSTNVFRTHLVASLVFVTGTNTCLVIVIGTIWCLVTDLNLHWYSYLQFTNLFSQTLYDIFQQYDHDNDFIFSYAITRYRLDSISQSLKK